jgi:hypothetical protein
MIFSENRFPLFRIMLEGMIPKSMPSGLTRGGYRFSEKILPK